MNYRLVFAFFSKHGFRDEAEDLAQEVFLHAYRGRENFRGDAQITTWLYQICRNVLHNRLRNQSAQKRGGEIVSLNDLVGQDSESLGADSGDDPLHAVLGQEAADRVRNAIDNLPPRMKMCVQLRIFRDLKYTEIAGILHVSIQSVRSQLFQARQTLKAALGEYFKDSEFWESLPQGPESTISHNVTSTQSLERVSQQPRGSYRELMELFLATTHGGSPNTLSAYRRHLEAFLRELGEEAPASSALEKYRDRLLHDGRGIASHRQALAAVRGFLAWVSVKDEGVLPLPAKTIRRLLQIPATEERRSMAGEVEAEVVDALIGHAPTTRDRAMISLFLGAGLRVDEVVRLNVDHFLPEKNLLMVGLRQRKGSGESRAVPLRPDVKALVSAYLEETGRDWESAGALFLPLPQRGGRPSRTGCLTARAVEYRLRQILKVAGIGEKKISARNLRQTFATRYLQETGDLKGLQKLLGHVSIGTTGRYRAAA